MKAQIEVTLKNLSNGNVRLELHNQETGSVIERTEMKPGERDVKHVADRIGKFYKADFHFDESIDFGKVKRINRKIRMAVNGFKSHLTEQ